jgi:hypothetical protein
MQDGNLLHKVVAEIRICQSPVVVMLLTSRLGAYIFVEPACYPSRWTVAHKFIVENVVASVNSTLAAVVFPTEEGTCHNFFCLSFRKPSSG